MALTGIIGALMAFVPAAKRARQIAANRCKMEDEQRTNADRMQALVDGLVRSRAQLIGHIELLERELAAERRMSAHWLGEAQRLIGERRRQESVVARSPSTVTAFDRDAPPVRSSSTRILQQQADLNRAMAQQNMALYQQNAQHQAMAQLQSCQQLGGQNLDAGMWCNCVPSRAQVWGASQGLVNQLNQEMDNGQIQARLHRQVAPSVR